MSELKPCPFCGTSVVGIEHDGLYRWVECGNMDCNAAGKVFAFLTDVGNADHIVANNWNTRPIEDALNARIAELEAEIDQLTAHDAAERQDDKWIPISENPTKSDWYLIMYQGYRVPDADYYDVEAGWLSDIPIPDYWMPLPEPPEVV